MPEGPEVTIIAQGLNNLLSGCYTLGFEFNTKSRYNKKAPDGFNEFQQSVQQTPTKVIKVANKGKFIYWTFSNGYILFQTLGLSGGWFHTEKNNSGCQFFFKHLKTGDIQSLFYDDQRRFGTLKFINNQAELDAKLATIGPDLLNDTDFDLADWLTIFHTRRNQNKMIFKVITDQKIVSGIGNYLKAEILYEAKISPHRLVHTLTDNELSTLYTVAKKQIKQSFKSGGTSIKNYSDIDNKDGTYSYQLKVYGKKKDPHGNSVKGEKIGRDSQTTYWVPNIQI